jgi:hypothetical protein
MELLNATGMPAGYTLGMKPDGRELLVVALKGTFTIPENGKEPTLAAEQVPLFEADVFTGEPGFSAPLYESDYPPYKPRCDVLLHGSAYAPGGKPTQRVRVTLQVGSLSKSFYVVGNRVWKKRLFFIKAASPEPFTVMTISYNNAFGGVDNTHKEEKKHRTYLTNHVGVGFHHNLKTEFVHNKPLPNTEELDKRVKKPRGQYQPMAFGPIGRAWQPRPLLAGTYDQNWLDNVFPFLPADFNEAYYQAAPPDQLMSYPQGGEEVVLVNLTSHGRRTFLLPKLIIPVVFFLKKGEKKETAAVIDTVVIEPDLDRFMLTWRSALPLRKNIFDVIQVVAGNMPRGWYRALETGKTYYQSLQELVTTTRPPAGEEEEEE